MSRPATCPEPEQLRQLLEETLPENAQGDLCAHLQECAHCQGILEGLVACRDSWAETSHILALPTPDEATEPALQRVLGRLDGRGGTARRGAAGEADDLSFLAPPTRPGAIGRL